MQCSRQSLLIIDKILFGWVEYYLRFFDSLCTLTDVPFPHRRKRPTWTTPRVTTTTYCRNSFVHCCNEAEFIRIRYCRKFSLLKRLIYQHVITAVRWKHPHGGQILSTGSDAIWAGSRRTALVLSTRAWSGTRSSSLNRVLGRCKNRDRNVVWTDGAFRTVRPPTEDCSVRRTCIGGQRGAFTRIETHHRVTQTRWKMIDFVDCYRSTFTSFHLASYFNLLSTARTRATRRSCWL